MSFPGPKVRGTQGTRQLLRSYFSLNKVTLCACASFSNIW
jgi:hypothetical protein